VIGFETYTMNSQAPASEQELTFTYECAKINDFEAEISAPIFHKLTEDENKAKVCDFIKDQAEGRKLSSDNEQSFNCRVKDEQVVKVEVPGQVPTDEIEADCVFISNIASPRPSSNSAENYFFTGGSIVVSVALCMAMARRWMARNS
jgi:hypothetical protein